MKNTPSISSAAAFLVAAGGLATAALTLLLPLPGDIARAELEPSPKAVLDEAWQVVNTHFVDDTFNQTDWLAVREDLLSRDYSSPESAYVALRRALATLEDPYTRFLNPEQFSALTTQTAGELSGIGLRLREETSLSTLAVTEPLPNSPAIRAGLRSGDLILKIDGRSTAGMSVDGAAQLIRGSVGSPVTLTIRRGSQAEYDVTLVRAQIEVPAVDYDVQIEDGKAIGYIRLTEFNSHAHEQMYRAIRELEAEAVQAFVLDLRGNPGGLLDVSVQIARMWIDEGAIVQTIDRHGNADTLEATNMALSDRPLTVLVDRGSASASEVLAGALSDNNRATIVGSQTYGKALVQAVNSLSDGSGLAVTVAHYYTPNGTDISSTGIAPDIRVDLTASQQLHLSRNPHLLGTADDPSYARAVSLVLDTIPIAANSLQAVQ